MIGTEFCDLVSGTDEVVVDSTYDVVLVENHTPAVSQSPVLSARKRPDR